MRPVTIFSEATGLNTVTDPVRIRFNKGVTDLQVAANIKIDQSGRINRRPGTTLLQAGAYHSLFCDGGDCFVVGGDSLYQVASDGSISSIRSGLNPGARMAFETVGARTYYSNGFQFGWIMGGISNAWEKGTYSGPDTTRFFSGPMPGHHLSSGYGRMLIAEDNVIWWSELYDYGLFDRAGSFAQFNTKILMVKAVTAGWFVSTEKNTYFLAGVNPKEWNLIKVASFPAVEWTVAIDYVEGGDLGLEPGLYALWASHEGAILGTPGGSIQNLNKSKIVYKECGKAGFGCLMGYDFIHGMN